MEDTTKALQLGKVLQFLQTLWGVEHELKSTSKQMTISLGVTGPQRLVIRIIGKFPGIGASSIAEVLHIHPSTLTGILTRLEEATLIQRTIDKEDRRRLHFRLTRRGDQINATTAGTIEAAVQRAITHFSEEQLTQTQEVLSKIAEELLSSRT